MSDQHDTDQSFDHEGQPFIAHLMELRTRLMWGLGAVLVVFLCMAPFANTLFETLAKPMMAALNPGETMVSIQPHGTFWVPFKFTFALAIAVAIPFLLYQIWAFVAPGLYAREKRLAFPLVVSSTLLFYLGILFCYSLVFPLIFAFFASTAPEGVAVMTDINEYLTFVLKLFFAFGFAFEVPIATLLLLGAKLTTIESLKRKRPYIIVVAFVAGMLLTPPDIFSQTLLAIPVWLLFELGLFAGARLGLGREDDDEEDDEFASDPTTGS